MGIASGSTGGAFEEIALLYAKDFTAILIGTASTGISFGFGDIVSSSKASLPALHGAKY